jgi:hypothetical protein
MPIYVILTVQYGKLVKDDSRVGQRTVLYGTVEIRTSSLLLIESIMVLARNQAIGGHNC